MVTGAARGIGRAIAERLGHEGARVAVLDVSASRTQQAVDEMHALGLQVAAHVVDVGQRDAVQRTLAAVEAAWGPVGMLVNNAAWIRYQPVAEIDEETLQRMLAVGVKAMVWTMQAALPGLQRSGHGALVTVAPDSIDWDDEVRMAIEGRTALSPDALTGMEANLRFVGPETMETRIFGRLTAWQNWIFQRPNAVGPKGALTSYGTSDRAEFDFGRT